MESSPFSRQCSKKITVMGDNCIDLYPDLGVYYVTGNAVDTAVNLATEGIPTSIITTIADDHYGQEVMEILKAHSVDVSHVKIAHGQTAITYMTMEGTERVHGTYIEGVLKNMVFDEEDIMFASSHDLVHTAFWGKAEEAIKEIKRINPAIFTSYDFADRLTSLRITEMDGFIDIGFFSYSRKDDYIEHFLNERVRSGMKIAIATLGENGSLAYDGERFYECGIIPTEVVNTVGAGDSFIAGFLATYVTTGDVFLSLEEGALLASRIISVFEPWI